MLVRMLMELIDLSVPPAMRGIRKAYVATPDGVLHEVVGTEKTFGGDLVIVVEPAGSIKSN